jgi:site-specific DNA recombinase
MVYLDDGLRLTPKHTNKQGKRYRYYCPGYQRVGDEGKPLPKLSIPAHDLETLIEREWKALLTSQALKDRLTKDEEDGMESIRQLRLLANTWDDLSLAGKVQRLREATFKVHVSEDKILLSANPEGIIERRIHPLTTPTNRKKPNPITRKIEARLYISHGEKKIIEPGNQAQNKEQEAQREQLLVRIAQGRAWANELIEGKVESTKALAVREKKSDSYIYDVIRAGCLAPGIVDKVIDRQGPVIDLDALMAPIAISWSGHSQLIANVKR